MCLSTGGGAGGIWWTPPPPPRPSHPQHHHPKPQKYFSRENWNCEYRSQNERPTQTFLPSYPPTHPPLPPFRRPNTQHNPDPDSFNQRPPLIRWRAAGHQIVILKLAQRNYFYYFRPFWPFSEGGILIIIGHFGHSWRAVVLIPPAIFGRFRRAVVFLLSAVLVWEALIRNDECAEVTDQVSVLIHSSYAVQPC